MSDEIVITETAETVTEGSTTTEDVSILNADDQPEETETTEKPPEEKPEEDTTPTEYEPFTMPEGLTLDEGLANVFKPIFAELKLDQTAAQKLVDLYSTEVVKKQIDAWNTTLESWDAAAKTDTEIGGTKYDASLKTAARAFKSFEVPEAAEVLAQYGLHRNPAIIKLFARIGAKMTESTEIITGETPAKGDRLDALYPTMKK